MKGHRTVRFRPLARAGLIPAILATGALALSSIPAQGATVIGQAVGTTQCAATMDTVQEATSGTSYAVPAGGGMLTTWSTTAGADLGPAGLLVWRPTATAGTYKLVAATAPVALKAGLNTFTLATPIAVQAGDLLGLRAQGLTDCIQFAAAGNTIGYFFGSTVGVGANEVFTTDTLSMTINVSATIGTVTPPTPTPTPTPTPGGGGTGTGSGSGGGSGSEGNNGGDHQKGEGSDSTKASHHATPKKSHGDRQLERADREEAHDTGE